MKIFSKNTWGVDVNNAWPLTCKASCLTKIELRPLISGFDFALLEVLNLCVASRLNTQNKLKFVSVAQLPLTQQRACVHKQIRQKKILLHFVIRLKINLLTNCTSLIKCCKSVQSKGNVLFSGLKRLLQRMLFIALLVFYLAVHNFCIYPLND